MAIGHAPAPLVGRDPPLGQLLAAAAAARGGRGSLVVLRGDPGIGKTRLLEALGSQARAERMRVLVGHCLEGGGTPPFWPWSQVFERWAEEQDTAGLIEEVGHALGVLAAAFPELRASLPNLPAPPPLDAELARFHLLDAVVSVLRRSSRKTPLLLVFEDVHWADAGSLRMLSFAARQLSEAPVLLAASAREAWIDDTDPLAAAFADLERVGDVIPLEGIDDDAIAELWRAASGQPPAAGLAARIRERTAGNPLFVLETIRSLGRRQPLDEAEVDEVALPDGIRQALRPRLSDRSEACQRFLEVAAVIGDEFDLPLLRRVATAADAAEDPDGMLSALSEAAQARLVERSPRSDFHHRFCHGLIRELLYQSLTPARQIELHARVARALEASAHDGDATRAQVAYHACKAAPGGGAEAAIGHARAAAQHAASRWAPEEAVVFLERALDVLYLLPEPRPQLQCDLLLLLAESQSLSGRREAAIASLLRAAELSRENAWPARLARAALAYPSAHTATTMASGMADPTATRLLREAIDALPTAECRLRARVLARLASTDPDGEGLSAEALALARELDDPQTLVLALDAHHFALWAPAHLDERLALALEMERVGQETGNAQTAYRACHAAAGEHLELGDRGAVLRTLDRMEHLARELRHPTFGLAPLHGRAAQVFLDGDLADYERRILEALRLAQELGAPDALAVFGGQLSMLRREQDRLDETLPALRGMAAQFPAVPSYRAALAWVHSEAGRREEALAELEAVAAAGLDAFPHDGLVMLSLHMLGEASARLSDAKLGAEVYGRLAPYAGRAVVVGAVICFGAADRTLGQLAWALGDTDAAAAYFEGALELDASMRAVPCLAHSRIETARFLLARGESDDADRARQLLTLAHSTARESTLPLAERRAREELSRLEGAASKRTSDSSKALPVDEAANLLRSEGDSWLLRYEGVETRLKASKGLTCLATLLAEPGREWSALELAGPPGGSGPATTDDPLLDATALSAYREQLGSLRSELAEAERFQDSARAERLRGEIDFLAAEVAAATGLGGRSRRAPGSSERARKAVYNRIRNTLDRIRSAHPSLGRHLEASVRTGAVCSYQPERTTLWRIG